MADKSVIQMTEERCRTERKRLGEVAVQRLQATMMTKMSGADIDLYLTAFDECWEMCTAFIVREGNCKFERGE